MNKNKREPLNRLHFFTPPEFMPFLPSLEDSWFQDLSLKVKYHSKKKMLLLKVNSGRDV